MTQLWPEGLPIQAREETGRPSSFRWQHSRRLVHAVVDQWIIHDEWWRQDEIWRHYFQLETAEGLLCVLYRNLLDGTWYLERVYD